MSSYDLHALPQSPKKRAGLEDIVPLLNLKQWNILHFESVFHVRHQFVAYKKDSVFLLKNTKMRSEWGILQK